MSATPGPSIAAIEPGLRVLVTAGAAGIGRTIAERLAGAGARVWVCDVDERALRACGEARPDRGRSTCDVADPAAVERMMGDARADAAGAPCEEMEGRYKRYSSLGRMITADDIAATALFLCGPGGLNISGQALSVCGDVDSI
jgi:NAD(P)-dependent dehydrogenase (short-subunit alcohol dehydrogenase family)